MASYKKNKVKGYQGGGKAGGRFIGSGDDVEFDEDAYGGGMRTGFTGFQTGGRASSGFGLQSAGIKTQRDIEDEAAKQAEKQGKWGMWGNLLGTAAGFAGQAFMPGIGGFLSKGIGDFLAKKGLGTAISYALPKALTKAAVTSTYKPGEFKSKTGFGLDKYKQLRDRGSKFRQRGFEEAGVGGLTDVAMAMAPNPLTGGRMGTTAEQWGVGPAEWGGYNPTADLKAAAALRSPEVMSQLQQASPYFSSGPQTLGGGPKAYGAFQDSLSGAVPSPEMMLQLGSNPLSMRTIPTPNPLQGYNPQSVPVPYSHPLGHPSLYPNIRGEGFDYEPGAYGQSGGWWG